MPDKKKSLGVKILHVQIGTETLEGWSAVCVCRSLEIQLSSLLKDV